MLAKGILLKSRFLLLFILLLTACAPQVAATARPTPASWSLVVVGDSIAFISPEDCPGCTGFVDRYAEAITAETGHPVEVQNLSRHDGLQIDGLLQDLNTDDFSFRREALINADIIIVNIAHNDVAWGRNDDPCDGPTGENPDWSKFDAACATEAAEIFRPKFESLYAQIVAMRAGKPTIFLTINRYNDWIGDEIPPEAIKATHEVVDAWSAMVCKAAASNGFICADIYHAFNGGDGLRGAPYLLAVDYIHPSDKGNEVIAQVLADTGFAPLVP